jgi:hypothetical protein
MIMDRLSGINREKSAVTNAIFGAAVAVLVVVAAVGFGLYGTSVGKTTTEISTSIVTTTSVTTQTTEMMVNRSASGSRFMENGTFPNMAMGTVALRFTPESGAMISSAFLISIPFGANQTAVLFQAQGLEPNGTYLLEGSLSGNSASSVPITMESMRMNSTSDTYFLANANGTGLFWTNLGVSIATTFTQIDLVYLPGMSLQNATIVATANINETSSTMATTTSSTS